MLVDKRNKALNTYEYSLVQFHNIWTKEVLNIGIILNDNAAYYIHLPRQYDKLKACLDFTELAGLKYTLDIIEDRINNQQRVTYGEVSNSVYITDKKSIKSELNAEDTLYDMTTKYMMIKKFRQTENTIITDKYDKLNILKLIESRAKAKDIKNFIQHRHFGITRKQIDMALVNKDNKPYSIASLASLHKDGFDDHVINGIFTLNEAKKNSVIKDRFLYIPIINNILKPKENISLGWAKEQAKEIGVDLLTDKRQDAVLERLNQYKPPKEELEAVTTL